MATQSQLEERFQLYWRLTGGTDNDWITQHRALKDYINKEGRDILTRHKFDFAMPRLKLAVEIQGIGGGRRNGHTSMKGYHSDREKMRLSMLQGWTVVELTTLDLKEKNIIQAMDEVREFINMLEGKVYQCTRTFSDKPSRKPIFSQRKVVPVRQLVLPMFGELVS